MDYSNLQLDPGKIHLKVKLSGVPSEPYLIQIRDVDANPENRIFYERWVKDSEVNINLPIHPDRVKLWVSRGKIESILKSPLKVKQIPYLDKPTHKRPYDLEDIEFRVNPHLVSPARMFTKHPIIEYNPRKMKKMTEPTVRFIFYHELGHHFFDDEEKADRWALITFLNQGFNLSSAIYALTRTLGKSTDNVKRMLSQHSLLKQLSKRFYG